ncbi:MAG: orotate phosphoribosyltransferase [Candidatus Dasytiphilus stammeri]
MKLWKRQFIEFILHNQVLKFGEFILKSGRCSPYFFNLGMIKTGLDLALLGRFYANALIDSGIDFDLIFGPAYKGILISTATTIALAEYYGKKIPYCFNRKVSKTYGEQGLFIGAPLKGSIILVDDVLTTGTTIHESMNLIQNAKINSSKLAGILIALDREEFNHNHTDTVKEVEKSYNCKVISLISITELINYTDIKNPYIAEQLRLYQKKYGYKYYNKK